MSNPNPTPPEWLELVEKQIAAIRYGTVQLTIQDAKVVQIETTEKVRLDKPPGKPSK